MARWGESAEGEEEMQTLVAAFREGHFAQRRIAEAA